MMPNQSLRSKVQLKEANLQELKNTRKKRHQFILGVIVLVVVDLLWVGSAELSDYIFKENDYNKPFFTTYFKTSSFIVFLFGFLFVKSWQYQLRQCALKGPATNKMLKEVDRISQGPRNNDIVHSAISCDTSAASTPGCITPPRYENMTDDEISLNGEHDNRKVTFNDVREVRSLAKRHTEAQILSRMSHNSVEELKNLLLVLNQKLSLKETIKLSLYFALLWTFATLAYQASLAKTSASVTNILSATSGIFTLCFAACFPSSNGDRFNTSKLIGAIISFGGIFIVCWTDPNRGSTAVNIGDLYAIVGAILYASYLVLIRKKVGEDKKLDMPLFFGFVGLFGALLFWPGFFILHYTKVETFELPPDAKTWMLLILNAAVGTLLSELLWLWGCFLTSSLMATLSLGLVAPLSMAFDIVVHKVQFSYLFFVGVVPILISFIFVSLLTHFEGYDPVADCFCKMFGVKGERHVDSIEEESALLGNDMIA